MSSVSFPADVLRAHPVIRTALICELETLSAIDSDASTLFEEAGLHLELSIEHEFAVAERARWLRCLAAGSALLAISATGEPIGFAAAGRLDGEPYLDQLSVRRAFMRRGIGTSLLSAVENMQRDTGADSLWLTTYSHLPWNRPYYERAGFVAVTEHECGREVLQELHYEQRWLPHPHERVVMRKALRSAG